MVEADLQPYIDEINAYAREIAAVTQLPGEPEVPSDAVIEMQARVNKIHADMARVRAGA